MTKPFTIDRPFKGPDCDGYTAIMDRILVKPIEPAQGPILMKASDGLDWNNTLQGVVVKVGPGKRGKRNRRSDMDVNVGDQVLFFEPVGARITYEGEPHLVMRNEDVLGVFLYPG